MTILIQTIIRLSPYSGAVWPPVATLITYGVAKSRAAILVNSRTKIMVSRSNCLCRI